MNDQYFSDSFLTENHQRIVASTSSRVVVYNANNYEWVRSITATLPEGCYFELPGNAIEMWFDNSTNDNCIPSGYIAEMTYSEEMNWVFISGNGAQLWSTSNYTLIWQDLSIQYAPSIMSPDGRFIATKQNWNLSIISTDSWDEIARPLNITPLIYSPDSAYLWGISGLNFTIISTQTWNVTTQIELDGKNISNYLGLWGYRGKIGFDRAGKFAYILNQDYCTIVDIRNWTIVKTFTTYDWHLIYSAAFSGDGGLFALYQKGTLEPGRLEFFRTTNWRKESEIIFNSEDRNWVYSVMLSHDGTKIWFSHINQKLDSQTYMYDVKRTIQIWRRN